VVVVSEASPKSVAGLVVPGLSVVASDVRPGTVGWMVLSRWPLVGQTRVTLVDRTMPRLVLRRPDGGDVVLWQVHPVAPVPGTVGRWRQELSEIRRALRPDVHGREPVVVAGDFNATRDLPAFAAILGDGWTDAEDGRGLLATWPVGGWLPPVLRLDHVLVDARVGVRAVWRSGAFGSDHRAVVTVLQLPPPAG
jgi:endonuclease/exonuclease/phosphatase (EEP) superfamily protein YafD